MSNNCPETPKKLSAQNPNVLLVACLFYEGPENLNRIKLLLKNKTDVRDVDSKGQNALFYSTHFPELTEVLLDHGVEINHRNDYSETAIYAAIRRGWNNTVITLLNHGINLDLRNFNNESAIHVAVKSRNIGALKAMLKNRDIDINHHVDDEGNTPLHLVDGEDFEILDLLLHFGGDLTVRNDLGRTPVSRISTKLVLTYFDKIALLKLEAVDENSVEFLQYRKELERLKRVKISVYPKVSLHDLLLFEVDELAKFSKNENLLQDFELDFPHYGILLMCRIKSGRRRAELVDFARMNLNFCLGKPVPELCSDEIFRHFSSSELKKFNEDCSCNPTKKTVNSLKNSQ